MEVLISGLRYAFNETGQIELTATLTGETKVLLPQIHEAKTLLQNKSVIQLILKKFFKKRSKNANDYMWELLGKLAKELGKNDSKITANYLYRRAVSEVGVWEDRIVKNEAMDKLIKRWRSMGEAWLVKIIDDAPEGQKLVRLYYGSSVYDTAEMFRLIKYVVEDCKAVGIQTATPKELAELERKWREQNG